MSSSAAAAANQSAAADKKNQNPNDPCEQQQQQIQALLDALNHAPNPADEDELDALLVRTLTGSPLPSDKVAVLAACVLANVARDECRRNKFSTDVVNSLTDIYARDTLAASDRHQLNRALANLVADHELHRQDVASMPFVLTLAKGFLDNPDKALASSTFAFLTNFTIDFEPGQAALIKEDVMPKLAQILEHNAALRSHALHLISVLVQNEDGRDQLMSLGCLDLIIDLLKEHDKWKDFDDDVLYMIEILEVASDSNGTLQRTFTVQFMQNLLLTKTILTHPNNFVAICQKRLHARHVHTLIFTIMEDMVNKEINEEKDLKSLLDGCLRIVVNLTHNDEIVADLLGDPEIKRLSGWLTYPDSIIDTVAEELVVCACLCLGNIARSDESAIILLCEHKVADRLLHVLESSKNAKVHLAALSALRHLAIPQPNKAYLGQTPLIDVAQSFLISPVPDIALTAAVIIRNLSSEERNMRAVIESVNAMTEKTTLQMALEACIKHADQPSIRCEVGRLIAALTKAAVKYDQQKAIAHIQQHAMAPLWYMLTLPYRAVYPEAVVALNLLLSKSGSSGSVQVPKSFASCANRLLDAEQAIEFRLNAAQLLLQIRSMYSEWKEDLAKTSASALAAIQPLPEDAAPLLQQYHDILISLSA